jgi:hypothetical protein
VSKIVNLIKDTGGGLRGLSRVCFGREGGDVSFVGVAVRGRSGRC